MVPYIILYMLYSYKTIPKEPLPMTKNKPTSKLIFTLVTPALLLLTLFLPKLKAEAVSFPPINITFDPTDESVIVDSIPANGANGVEYQLEGYLNYEKVRIETFCYAPNVKPYDVPAKQAYIFNWGGDVEFLLPCTGDYKFTAYLTARYIDAQGNGVEEKGPKTTISITLHKKDESTNWGPGLPNTTVEDYDLEQIKGKDKTIKVEEPDYTWSIYGKDIVQVPDGNISLKITPDPEGFQDAGVEEFFGDTKLVKFSIEHSGEFGFTASLNYLLGVQYAGKYANLFYVVGNGTFEFMGHSLVTEEGLGTFLFTHASDYVIAILEEEYIGQTLKTPEPEVTEAPAESVPEESMPAVSEAPAETGAVSKEEPTSKETHEVVETIDAKEDSNTIRYVLGGAAALAILLTTIFVIVVVSKKKK